MYTAPDSFVGKFVTAFREQILNLSIARSEPGARPHGMAGDFGRETVALEKDVLHLEMLLWHAVQTPVC